MPQRVLQTAAAVCIAILVAGGCRSALRPESPAAVGTANPSDRTRSAPKTIPLEFVFVRHEENDPPMRDELWNLADEQVFDQTLRRRLLANGLRAGVITAQLPPHLAERFLPPSVAPGDSLPAAISDNPALVRHVLRQLPGRSSDVLAATGLDELVLLEHDGESLRGKTYRDASAMFVLRAWPAADGRVRLNLSPTIKHGPVERSWVGEDGMFRLEAGQRRDALAGLTLEAVVPVGSMMIIGCVGDPASTAGDAFFRDRGGARSGQRLLAIRPVPLSQSLDPLFNSIESESDAEDR